MNTRSKKAQKIIEEFNKRVEMWLDSYAIELIDTDKCFARIKEERNNIESLITNMFRYSLLSEKDFNDLWEEVHFTGRYTFEKVLDLIYK